MSVIESKDTICLAHGALGLKERGDTWVTGDLVSSHLPAVSIDSIQEVSEGRQSEIFQRYPDSSFDPNCCFSIYYGSHRESLDLVSPSGEEARTWVTGLRYLMAGISDEDSLARRQRTRDQYPWAPGVGTDSWSRLHCPPGLGFPKEGKMRRGAWAGDSCSLLPKLEGGTSKARPMDCDGP